MAEYEKKPADDYSILMKKNYRLSIWSLKKIYEVRIYLMIIGNQKTPSQFSNMGTNITTPFLHTNLEIL